MKKLLSISLITSIFLLTGCFGGEDSVITDPTTVGFKTYNTSIFTISVPEAWDVIEPNEFTSDIPRETQVIFKNNIKNDNFTANANITKKLLSSPMTTLDFAKSEINGNKTKLLNYSEISRNDESTVIVAGQVHTTVQIMFEGKQAENQPTLRFIQTFAVNGTDAYTATIAYLKDSDEILVDNAKAIINTFKIK